MININYFLYFKNISINSKIINDSNKSIKILKKKYINIIKKKNDFLIINKIKKKNNKNNKFKKYELFM